MKNIKNYIKLLSYSILICCITFPVLLTGCGTTIKDPVSVTGYKLNTYVTIKSYTTGGHSTTKLNQILDEALSMCDKYEMLFSRTHPDSTLYKVNSGETKVIPAELAELIQAGIRYGEISDGAFDISIGAVSSLWDFTADTPVIPDSGHINTALSSVDYTNIKLTPNSDGTFTIEKPSDMIIDLGAVAKGYIADKLKEFLLKNNINHALIDLGGNILCVGGKTESSNFNVGIKKPFSEKGETLVTLSLNNVSAVSSGNYERYFYENDTLYHHILNPKTGYPYDNNLSGVTIISESSLMGDCLSTTSFALGLEEGLKLINNTADVEAMFVTNTGEVHYSDGFNKYIK
ncbi:MAG: FAD:protein FMN transferase [Lachnospira sp.]|nr:FAD:protein FMN transferase [Lachnospira sp.]